MQLFCRLLIFWLLFVLNLQPRFVKSLSNGVDVEVSSDYFGAYKFNHLTINQSDGTVFIGAMNQLYILSHNLKVLSNITTCIFDPKNYNKILVLDYWLNQLIICGTSAKCSCSAYHFKPQEKRHIRTTLHEPKIALGGDNASTVAFISNSNDAVKKLVVAVSNNGCFFHSSNITVRYLDSPHFLHTVHENKDFYPNTPKGNFQLHCRVNYVYGFNLGIYNYLLTTELYSFARKSTYISKLIRVCDNKISLSQGYSEIPIKCEFGNGTSYALVQAATIAKPNPQLAKSLKIGFNDDVLFAVFSKIKNTKVTFNEASNHNALCIYSLKEIDEKFTENIRNCFEGKRNQGLGSILLNARCTKTNETIGSNFCTSEVNMPLDGDLPITKSPVITFNTRMTAIAIRRNQNHNEVFVGTNTGHLKNIKVINSTSACELTDLPIDEGSPVNSDLLFSPNKDFLYVMTEHNLTRIKIPIIPECSENKNFSACIQSSDYCGWCVSSNKCTTKCECHIDNYSSWCSRDFRNNIEIAAYNAESLINPGDKLKLNITKRLSMKDTFHCAFFFENKTVQTSASFFNMKIYCSAPQAHEILKTSSIVDNLIIKLSICSLQIGELTSTNITISRCFTFTSCDSCVSNKFRCQWHSTKKQCLYAANITDTKACESIPTKRPQSSPPSISSFWPLQGPVEGGTNITIRVSNLAYKFEDINQTIKVAGIRCTPHEDMFVPMEMIGCGIEKSNISPGYEGPVEIHLNGTPIISPQKFKFLNPEITYIDPNEGPAFGDTPVKIAGKHLMAGRSIQAFIGKTCTVFLRNSSVIQCITESYTKKEVDVFVKFDGNTRYLTYGSFRFVKDKLRDENGFNYEPKGILNGGVEILIRNISLPPTYELLLRIHSEKKIYNISCKSKGYFARTWTCLSPFISDIDSGSLNAATPREMNVSFEDYFESSKIYFNKTSLPSRFWLYPNPKFDYFINSSLECGEDIFIIITGQNINKACQKTDMNVTVGNQTCEVLAISSTQVICRLPKSFSSRSADDSEKTCDHLMDFTQITVSIGENFKVNVSKQENPPPENPTHYCVYIICGIIIFILIIILATHYLISKNIITRSFKKLKKTQQKMNNLELCVASECKEAFAELQTQVTTFSTDNSCTALPFLKYHTYIMNISFPNTHDHSVILNGKDIPIHKEIAIQSFRPMIMNRSFLLSFVRTLEREQSFSMNDRVYVASMLMISLKKDMEYCTEILQTLLAELIDKNLRNGSHPKLLLRRTESIVEKMLSAWFSFLLYKFLKETAGQPLFSLFNVIKEHVNRGPVDMITSQARYCLSENKMLRQKIVFFPLTIYVNISQQTAEIFEIESPIEKVPVEVLDCDTISQFKEKALDAISCKIKFNRSVNPSELNVEWFSDPIGRIILSDDDSSSVIDGEWKRKNTLKHYKVPDGCALNLIPHEQTKLLISAMLPDFNLQAVLMDMKSELASLFQGMQKKSLTDHTTTLIQSSDVHYKEWHLVKRHDPQDEQEDHNGSNRLVPEIFLTRLLGVKSSLLKFIDELFATIFNNPNQGNRVPIPIKYMFDFLDHQALLHNINDPEVVHVWKNNCLPLRFWVNLIKNPNFLFDVRKSNIVDSCLSVVAQVFMDSCSTSEQLLNKDSATTKLLFAKEIPVYNEMVKKYYADIKNMPKITSEDMNAMLAEESKTCDTDFDTNASIYELFKYAMKYKEKLIDALKNEEFSKQNVLVIDFEKLIKSMSDFSDFSDES